jgi:hypothetical protein
MERPHPFVAASRKDEFDQSLDIGMDCDRLLSAGGEVADIAQDIKRISVGLSVISEKIKSALRS